jgi:hypothetical protein
MSNCVPFNCDQDIPVPTPTPLPPCPDGEPCKEVVDAGCVVYTDEPLPAVNVQTNDRLDDIIRKWAQSVLAGTQAVSTDTTPTTTIEGNGTIIQPLKVDVKISSRPQNLLKVVDEIDETNVHRMGLEVLLTNELIASILTMIAGNDTLNQQFCDLVRPCLDNACRLATDLQVTAL